MIVPGLSNYASISQIGRNDYKIEWMESITGTYGILIYYDIIYIYYIYIHL